MARRLLDTSVMITFWRRISGAANANNRSQATAWARDLIGLHQTNAIVTPVVIEFLAGVTSSSELEMARTFLREFQIADGGRILGADWTEARRLAERIPRDGKPRQLGDCLILAIANRLKYEVLTFDLRFAR